MTTAVAIDVAAGFPGDVLPPVSIDDAASRILAYCTSHYSGWAVYDLVGIGARSAGLLDDVSTWSLLFANALNGRIELKQIANFDLTRRREFAHRVSRIPAGQNLHHLTHDQLNAVIHACQFGFDGVWAPRITKLAALYRPQAIPVLDGYVGMAFGYQRDDLSLKVQRFGLNRQERIAAIVRAMAVYLRDHAGTLAQLRAEVSPTVPELAAAQPGNERPLIADLRLLDMVVWTAMDDRLAAGAGLPPKWLGRQPGAHIPCEAVAPVPIPAPAANSADHPQVILQSS
ncbi:DUF6308 family protein [Micromonospora sp. NPDC000729]|uniref:DUF6308 family protein n=1 Tax=Micromonospora sp. NPDC000729 TaxID=3364220 RepID=UPI003675619D